MLFCLCYGYVLGVATDINIPRHKQLVMISAVADGVSPNFVGLLAYSRLERILANLYKRLFNRRSEKGRVMHISAIGIASEWRLVQGS